MWLAQKMAIGDRRTESGAPPGFELSRNRPAYPHRPSPRGQGETLFPRISTMPSPGRSAFAVIGAAYGDEGKGLMTDRKSVV